MRNFYLLLFSVLMMNLGFAQFTQGFESSTIPSGWTIINGGGPNTWIFGATPNDANGIPVAACEGTKVAQINTNLNLGHSDYLITPAIPVTLGTNGYISFCARNADSFFPDKFDVVLSTTGTAAANFTVTLASNVVPTTSWTTYQYNLNAYNGQTVYVAIKATTANDFNLELDIDNFQNFAGPACPEPSSVHITQNAGTSVTLAWNAGAIETNWDIKYGASGFDPNTAGTLVTATGTPTKQVTGLTQNTQYCFYVRANCGGTNGTSQWVGPLCVTTIVNYCGGQFLDPGGAANYANNANVTTVISPVNATDRVRVTFTSFNTESGWDGLMIYNGPDTSSPLISSGSTFNRATCPNGAWTGTTTFAPLGANATFVSTHPSGKLTFVFKSDGSGVAAGWVANVVCEPQPACPDVSNISASSITTTSAQLSWISSGTAFDIAYGTAAFTPSTPNFTAVSNPYSLTGLTQNTTYYVYVRNNCGTAGVGAWAGPYTFTTATDFCVAGVFYDNGGPSADYAASSNQTTVMYPSTGNRIKVTFNSFATEANWDFLRIYDGPDATYPALHTGTGFTGTTNPGTFTANNAAGALTFVFTSDGIVNAAGWNATVQCIPQVSCPQPTSLSVVSTTTNSATISWQTWGPPTQWQVIYVLAGQDPVTQGIIATPNATSTTYTITGLNHSTQYEYYVKALCSGSEQSVLSGPKAFQTKLPNDECATAIQLTPAAFNQECASPVNGTVNGATDSGLAACNGTANDDVWYYFDATSDHHSINLTNLVGTTTNMVTQVFSGNCSALTSIACSTTATTDLTGLTVGNRYYFRVHSFGSTATNTSFAVCVKSIPPLATNDACSAAIAVTALPYTNSQAGYSSTNNSGFVSGCAGGSNDGVWYTFVGTGENVTITVTPTSSWNVEIGVYDTPCGSSTVNCVASASANGTGFPETTTFTTVAGTTYYVNVAWIYASLDLPEGDFTINISAAMNVDDIIGANQLVAIYPNPTSDILNILAKENIKEISLFDLSGKSVMNNIAISNNTISLNKLQKGVYMLKVTLENGNTEVHKVIKK